MAETDKRRTLLVVEDNELNREMLAGILEDDYEILQAENGQVGLDMLKEYRTRISLILLDIQMPVLDGFGFLEAVSEDPYLAQIPVIVTTANQSGSEEVRCLQMGASDFVTKPYVPLIIRSRVQSLIRLKESGSTLAAIETDEVTGVYIRSAFLHYAEERLAAAGETRYDLLITAFDRFEELMSRYEEQAEKLLISFARFVRETYGDRILIGHYTDDKFAFLVKDPGEDIYEEKLADGEYHTVHTACGELTLKLGIYRNIPQEIPVSQSCSCAILALRNIQRIYQQDICYYDEAFRKKQEKQLFITSHMHQALEEEEFQVWFQPKHDTATGRLAGAEALIRWISPEAGFMNPGEFMSVFEQNGFVTEVDAFVWEKVCAFQRSRLDQGLPTVPISVNASRIDLYNESYVDRILKALHTWQVPAVLLHLEITETMFIDQQEVLTGILNRIRSCGVEIELDDFGTGYSSLNALSNLPIDIVKLDMSFMKKETDPKEARLLIGCINLCRSLGFRTVQEGVESELQYRLMQILGVDYIQGYYFSRPLAEEAFTLYMKEAEAKKETDTKK